MKELALSIALSLFEDEDEAKNKQNQEDHAYERPAQTSTDCDYATLNGNVKTGRTAATYWSTSS